MLIRSQDRTKLVDITGKTITVSVENEIRVFYDNNYIKLGKYSSLERASKVLDKIEEYIINYNNAHTISSGLATMLLFSENTKESKETYSKIIEKLSSVIVFQMPKNIDVKL